MADGGDGKVIQRALTAAGIGLAAAIIVTTSLDAAGLSLFSALALFPVLLACWLFWRMPWEDMGFVWGRPRDYALAVLYPVVVLGAATAIAFVSGASSIDNLHLKRDIVNFSLLFVQSVPIGLITEEGFFRGWFWASLGRARLSNVTIILITSVAFALWHISLVTVAKGFTLPVSQTIIYIVNIAVIGSVWGQMRALSRSIVVTSVSHSLWNAGTYVLFGTGTFLSGYLGVKQTELYGAEVGLIGFPSVCGGGGLP
jgi:membrane protease YdiL (CAAX protease family)